MAPPFHKETEKMIFIATVVDIPELDVVAFTPTCSVVFCWEAAKTKCNQKSSTDSAAVESTESVAVEDETVKRK